MLEHQRKKVLILSTSLRRNGNSDTIAREFERGALEAGHEVEFVSLIGKSVNFCIGCYGCFKTKKCFRDDDASAIVEKMRYADVLVFATPVYSNQMCGQMKTLLDRTNPIYSVDYCFREIYLLTSAAMDDESVSERAIEGLRAWIECFHKAELKGVVRGVGMDHVGDAKKNPKLLKEAYEMGRNV